MYKLLMQTRAFKFITMACSAIMMSATAEAGVLDGWVGTAGGNWVVQPGNDSVLQTLNGNATYFYNPVSNAINQALSGKIKVQTTVDDDFIGFALGFDSSDLNSATANFILVDWKQTNQSGAARGLAISHVTDSRSTAPFGDLWNHTPPGVNEIRRATNLGGTGWVDLVEYDFDIQFTANLIEVSVNGMKELSITAVDAGLSAFDSGAFAFYNQSQSQVLYSQIDLNPTVLPVPAVPEPAGMVVWSLLACLAGVTNWRRKWKLRGSHGIL